MKILWFLIQLLSLSLFFSCIHNSEPPEDMYGSFLDTRQYDSVKFYKDVVWTSYKGIAELPKDRLDYPYTAFGYKGDSVINVFIVYGKDRVKKQYLKRFKNLWCARSRYYNPDFRKTMYLHRFFRSDGSSITIDCAEELPIDTLHVRSVYDEKDSQNIHTNKLFFTGLQYCLFKDLLFFDTTKLNRSFADYGEECLEIRSTQLFRTYDYFSGTGYKKSPVLVQNQMKYPSFFYFYNDDNLYEGIP